MSKTKYLNNNIVYNDCVRSLNNKYYNLFRRQIKVNGLDYRQEDYLMRKLYKKGTIAAFKIKGLDDEIGFASWCMNTHDMYNNPETVSLVNEYSSPLIPSKPLTVDKDVVLGWITRSRSNNNGSMYTIKDDVDYYINRIAQVEVVINNNLQLHKMPFLITVDEAEKDKAEDIVDKILNGDLVVFNEGIDPATFKSVVTGQPYLIDKLNEYKIGLENELKTLLGIDNQGAVEKREQLNLDETNANNNEINDNIDMMVDCLNEFADRIKETLGYEMSFERNSKPITAIGEYHEGEQPGPDGGNEDVND